MVSAIWNAASEGNLEAVKRLLQEHPSIDVEIKGHSGATPLIQAVRNGHIGVVSELLNLGGANPFNGTPQGGPETYTTDDAILQLLAEARDTYVARSAAKDGDAPQTSSEQPNGLPAPTFEPPQAYYRPMPPPGAEHAYAPGYYVTEGGYFVVPQQPVEYPPSAQFRGPQQQPSENTKNIPCRYFPNCRYGVSCHYAHPALPAEPGYYAIPPPQPYLPYDPNAPIPYNPQFYPGHPGFPPPHQIISQPPPPAPASPQLDATSPAQSPESIGQFPPPPHPPSGYAMTPYASANGVPAAYIAPFPAGAPGAYPTFPYPPPSPTQQRSGEQLPIPIYTYPPFAVTTAGPTATSTATPSSAPTTETEFRKNGREAAADGSPRPAMNGAGRHARDTPFSRRPSRLSVNYSGPRKTQALCMFFPSGKCRNGDDCRFVHALPEDSQSSTRPIPLGLKKYRERGFSASGPQEDRRGEFEVRYPNYGGVHPDKASIAQALASLPSNMRALNISNSRNNPTRSGFSGLGATSSTPSTQKSQPHQQRVPSEEDFPSLNGSTRAPTTNGAMNAIAPGGKTAAQILKSSPPATSGTQKFRPKDPIAPRPGEISSSSSEKTADAESLKSGGTNNTDQLTRPTSPEDSASELPKPHASTIEVPPVHA